MRAVVLAGGLGTRLRPYTTVIPKPLVPVGGRPIVEHIIHTLSRAAICQIDLCVGHLGELIELYLAQVALPKGVTLKFYREKEPMGTAGALRLIPNLEDTFLVMNGDVLTNLDYAALIRHHSECDALLTIATRATRVTIDLGVLRHTNGDVYDYLEKPALDYDVSMGVYVYDRRALRYLLKDGACQFPDLVLQLLAAGQPVTAYRTDADWFDIGTTEEHERACRAIEHAPERFGMSAATKPRRGSPIRRKLTAHVTDAELEQTPS
jgi:NDP-sugar pyrophosphorylase family protein